MVDTLSRHHLLLNVLGAQVLGFDHIKKLYHSDDHFSVIFSKCLQKPFDGFSLSNGYLLSKGILCIPNSSIRQLLVTMSQ